MSKNKVARRSKPVTMTLFHIADSDSAAIDALWRSLMFSKTGGDPSCPSCGCTTSYQMATRRRLRCKKCLTEFTLTSATAFAGMKLPLKKLLLAISMFVTSAHGVSSKELANALHIAPSAAAVLLHKLREFMALEQADWILDGVVEIDGGIFGGYLHPENIRWKRQDRRKIAGNEECVIFARERKGRCITAVFQHESHCIAFVRARVAPTAYIVTDQAAHWLKLKAWFKTGVINHKLRLAEFPEDGPPLHTNNVECAVGRLRKAEDIYHRVAGPQLHLFAAETAWRLNHRLETPDEKLIAIMKIAAAVSPASLAFRGYYQRRTGRNDKRRPDPNKVRNPSRRRALLRRASSASPQEPDQKP